MPFVNFATNSLPMDLKQIQSRYFLSNYQYCPATSTIHLFSRAHGESKFTKQTISKCFYSLGRVAHNN